MFEIDVRNGSAMLCCRAGEQHDASEINPIAQKAQPHKIQHKKPVAV